jgi:hypothetical protein
MPVFGAIMKSGYLATQFDGAGERLPLRLVLSRSLFEEPLQFLHSEGITHPIQECV